MKGIQTLKALIKIHTTLFACQDYKCPPSPALHAATEILKSFYSPEGQGHRSRQTALSEHRRLGYTVSCTHYNNHKRFRPLLGEPGLRDANSCAEEGSMFIYIYKFFNQVPLTLIPHVLFPYNVNVGEGAGMEDHM